MGNKTIKDIFKWPDFKFYIELDKFCHDKFREHICNFVIMEIKSVDGSTYDLATTRNFSKEQCETLLDYLTRVCPMTKSEIDALSSVVNALQSYPYNMVWYNDYIFIATVRADQLFNTPELWSIYNELLHDCSALLGAVSNMVHNFIYHYKEFYKEPKNAEELLDKIAILRGDKIINGFKLKCNGKYDVCSNIDKTFTRDEIKNFSEREIEILFRLAKTMCKSLY